MTEAKLGCALSWALLNRWEERDGGGGTAVTETHIKAAFVARSDKEDGKHLTERGDW